MIAGVSKNLPKFYEYYKLKQDIMGIKDFHLYDTYASITKQYDCKYSFEEAKNLLLESLSSLGDKYIDIYLFMYKKWFKKPKKRKMSFF